MNRSVFDENGVVYSAEKIWGQPKREQTSPARHMLKRLMRDLGLCGAIREKTVRATIPGNTAEPQLNLVERQFTETRPNQLYVAGFHAHLG